MGAAYNKTSLQALGITHILTAAANIKPRFPDDFKYEILDCLDSPNQNVLSYVDQANKFLNDAFSANVEGEAPKHKVLVHCFAGKSRATSFTLAYMIKERKIALKDGLDLIWKVRPIAAPNPGFMVQLKALERAILGSNTDVDVMQGDWKDKLDTLVKKKQEAGVKVELPSNDVIESRAQISIMKDNGIVKVHGTEPVAVPEEIDVKTMVSDSQRSNAK